MTEITIRNDFHNTSYTLRLTLDAESNATLSAATVRRVGKALCPPKGCTCGAELGQRGKQDKGWFLLDRGSSDAPIRIHIVTESEIAEAKALDEAETDLLREEGERLMAEGAPAGAGLTECMNCGADITKNTHPNRVADFCDERCEDAYYNED